MRLVPDLATPMRLDDLARRHAVTTRTIRRDLDVVERVLGLERMAGAGGAVLFALRRRHPNALRPRAKATRSHRATRAGSES
jgi:DeoR/GlpR family transcriptional regulator of sugar metabolism